MIRAAATTTNSISDGEMLPVLLEQVPQTICQVSADGGYDRRTCYEAIAQRGAKDTMPKTRCQRHDAKDTMPKTRCQRHDAKDTMPKTRCQSCYPTALWGQDLATRQLQARQVGP